MSWSWKPHLELKAGDSYSLHGILEHFFCLTYGWQLRHTADVGTLQELGLAVVDVLHLDDELWLRFQGVVGQTVPRLSPKRVKCLLFSVQSLGGVDVSCQLIDDEDGTNPFSGDCVLDVALTFIRVCMDLKIFLKKRKISGFQVTFVCLNQIHDKCVQFNTKSPAFSWFHLFFLPKNNNAACTICAWGVVKQGKASLKKEEKG